jgi:hypothetical protein
MDRRQASCPVRLPRPFPHETTMSDDYARAYPRWKPNLEPMALESGALFLNSHVGDHRTLSGLTPFGSKVTARIDGETSIAEIAAQVAAEPSAVWRLVERLVEAGLVDVGPLRVSARIAPELDVRFGLFVDCLDSWSDDARGAGGFERLRGASVGVIGVGGHGSVAAMALAAAGIGALRLIDGDRVEPSNLVRQWFYDERDVGAEKAHALGRRLRDFSSFTEIDVRAEFVGSAAHARSLLRGLDFVLLCGDAPRFVLNRWVNEACVALRVPYLNSFNGPIGPMYVPGRSPCFECVETSIRRALGPLHDEIVAALQKPRPRPYPSGIGMSAVVGTIQAEECIRYLSGLVAPLSLGHMLHVRRVGELSREPMSIEPGCAVCGLEEAVA